MEAIFRNDFADSLASAEERNWAYIRDKVSSIGAISCWGHKGSIGGVDCYISGVYEEDFSMFWQAVCFSRFGGHRAFWVSICEWKNQAKKIVFFFWVFDKDIDMNL